MDLAVAMRRAVGPGQHEHVRRTLIVRRRVGRDLRARPADPHAVGRRHRPRGTSTTVRPSCSPMPGVSNEKPVEKVSVSSTSPAPPAAAAADHRGQTVEVGVAVVPDDVVLHGRDAQRRHANPLRQSIGGLVDHAHLLAAREPHHVSPVLAVGRRTPRSGSPRRRTAPAALGRTPSRRRSGRPERMSTVTKYVASGHVGREPGGDQPLDESVARRLQSARRARRSTSRAGRARRRSPAGTAHR